MYDLKITTTIIILMLISFIISSYLMAKGMDLDLEMPNNIKRYRKLKTIHYVPLINVIFMFIYLLVMLHKFKRI